MRVRRSKSNLIMYTVLNEAQMRVVDLNMYQIVHSRQWRHICVERLLSEMT